VAPSPRRRTYRGRTIEESRARSLEEAAQSLPSRRVRGRRRRNLYLVAAVVVIAFGAAAAYAIDTAPHGSSGGGTGPTGITVEFGQPSSGHVACAGGKSMATEQVAWLNASAAVSTSQFRLEVQEIGDGDVIGADNAPGAVTPTALCVGPAQPYVYDWYGVLVAPNGTNEATYTYANGWQPVPPAVLPILVATNSTVIVVSTTSFAGLGYALEALPFGDGPPVNGFSAL
jgi:hypothetical protein